MILQGYRRSATGYRSRVAFDLTGLTCERAPVGLGAGSQRGKVVSALGAEGIAWAAL